MWPRPGRTWSKWPRTGTRCTPPRWPPTTSARSRRKTPRPRRTRSDGSAGDQPDSQAEDGGGGHRHEGRPGAAQPVGVEHEHPRAPGGTDVAFSMANDVPATRVSVGRGGVRSRRWRAWVTWDRAVAAGWLVGLIVLGLVGAVPLVVPVV